MFNYTFYAEFDAIQYLLFIIIYYFVFLLQFGQQKKMELKIKLIIYL